MIPYQFRCLLVESQGASTQAAVVIMDSEQLKQAVPDAQVTIAVQFSSLNYKDAMAVQGHRGIVKHLPHVPGIDVAGKVLESESEAVRVGDQVLVTGYDLGQGQWGGWSELVRVPASWVVPLTKSLDLREAMILGTAGFTAAQSVMALQRNEVLPGQGEILVTGATGGVGSLSVCMLAKLGYDVVALTGKPQHSESLLQLGAKRVVGRDEVLGDARRPLLSSRWAGAIDTVGGEVLNSLLRSMQFGGCVTACGLVAGSELNMTVYPFLLRGISLCGIASADCPYEKRLQIWQSLSSDLKISFPAQMIDEVGLEQLPQKVADMLAGQSFGRCIVNLSK